MLILFRLFLIIEILFFTGFTIPAVAKSGDPNPMEIVIANGPFAGTYESTASETMCLHVKGKQYSASYKDFNANDPKKLSEAGISIDNPDDPGAKNGEVRISFGNPEKNPVIYDLHIIADGDGPLTASKSNGGVTLAFHGKTKDGVMVSITANCMDIEEF
jgi:hypothetical protein